MYKMKQLKNIGGGVRIMYNYGITPLSTMFKLYCGSQFYRWRKQEYLEKTTLKI
jgi:hypothetical protein